MACEAIQVLGGNGYITEYPAGRLLRDAKLYQFRAGTSEIRRMLIAASCSMPLMKPRSTRQRDFQQPAANAALADSCAS